MNITMIWLMAIPLVIGAGVWYVLKDRFSDAWIPALANAGVGIVMLFAAFYGARGVATADTEIWNGHVTGKTRDHGSYEESYDCNCRTVTRTVGSGKDQRTVSETKCDTCYRTHYTVKWDCQTTLGTIRVADEDSLSSSVYMTPDPQRYRNIVIGEPASKTHMYTNYIQAVPDSLFKPAAESLKAKFAGLIPQYPLGIYEMYKIDRFLSPGYSIPEAKLWSQDISKMLIDLGPKKQVNAIVVVAKTDDPNYEYALRDAWEGANKNDVVLVIGSKEYPKIDFVRVISWTKSELFKNELRDAVMDIGEVRREPILTALNTQISKNFERRRMREFQYLEAEIDPPLWVMVTTIVLLLAIGAGTVFYIQKQTRFMSRRYRR